MVGSLPIKQGDRSSISRLEQQIICCFAVHPLETEVLTVKLYRILTAVRKLASDYRLITIIEAQCSNAANSLLRVLIQYSLHHLNGQHLI